MNSNRVWEHVYLILPVLHVLVKHYDNMPMQYTAIFHGCKNGNFQMRNGGIFLTFALNMDCGYTFYVLEQKQ